MLKLCKINNRRFLILSFVALSAVMLASCNKKNTVLGRWQMVEYCYGNDCVELLDYNINQIWELKPDAAEVFDSLFVAAEWHPGQRSQDKVMNENFMWALSADADTLFVMSDDGSYVDDYCLASVDADTMVLSSMMSNILVVQRFVRL